MASTVSASDHGNGDEARGCGCACTCGGSEVGDPFGLPVLSEVPELASALELVRKLDRLQARLLDRLVLLVAEGIAEATTGVGLDQWLATVGQVTRSDRRMLTTTVKVLGRLPSVAAAFSRGTVSWSQLRMLVLKVNGLPSHLDGRLDTELGHAIAEISATAAPADPDALAHLVTWVLAGLHPDEPADQTTQPDDVLVLQPRLDGTGGRYWGEAGPVGFALLDAATDPGPSGLTASKGGFGQSTDTDTDVGGAVGTSRNRIARARADRLYRRLAGHTRPAGAASTGATDSPDGGGGLPPVKLLARAELSTLLDRDRMPTDLLTSLAGGRMRLTSHAARQLVDVHGAELRLIVTDHGKVVGVGRSRREPPGWLRDAVLALHDVCSEPGCTTAATVCDLDHATPWTPHRDRPGGRTDIDQLAPLCRPANRTKERDGWTATQTADGVRTWRHARSGMATTTLPSTWRPPPAEPRAGPPDGGGDPRAGPDDRRPPGPDPRAGPAPGSGDPPTGSTDPPDSALPF